MARYGSFKQENGDYEPNLSLGRTTDEIMAAVDEVSQAERRRIVANDRQVANDRKVPTYRDAAQASIDDLCGGRYGAIGKPTVTGAAPISYPRLPSDAPSNQAAIVGDEPPLGIDVNAMEPVGEIHEREPKRKGWRRI